MAYLRKFNARFDDGLEPRALPWLEPLLSSVADILDESDTTLLSRLEDDLSAALGMQLGETLPIEGAALLSLKRSLAPLFGAVDVPRRFGGVGRSMHTQLAMQFVCGYYDLNLRDCAHVGHGRAIVDSASTPARSRWLHRAVQGDLVGIAVTEPAGGSRLRNIRLHGVSTGPSENWAVSGRKAWISRINEASVFVVLLLLEDDEIPSVALVDAAADGLVRSPRTPDGLNGWSWGDLEFDAVELTEDDLLSARCDGLETFNRHFAYYRPIVAATALGAAARVFDIVSARLLSRHGGRDTARVLDTSAEVVGRSYRDIAAALLHVFQTARLVTAQHPDAVLWAKLTKVGAVETAVRVGAGMVPLLGAEGYAADHPTAKILRDLRAFLFADGIHDALVQSSGRALLAPWLREGVEAEAIAW